MTKRFLALLFVLPLLTYGQETFLKQKVDSIGKLISNSYNLQINKVLDNNETYNFDLTLNQKHGGGNITIDNLICLYSKDPYKYFGYNYTRTQRELLKGSAEEKKLVDSMKTDVSTFCNQIYYFDLLSVFHSQTNGRSFEEYDLKRGGYRIRLSIIEPMTTIYHNYPKDYKSALHVNIDKLGVTKAPDAYFNQYYKRLIHNSEYLFIKVPKENAAKIEMTNSLAILVFFDTYGTENFTGQYYDWDKIQLVTTTLQALKPKNMRFVFLNTETDEILYTYYTQLLK